MTEETRRSPEEFLKIIKKEEEEKKKGRLKIFLGMAAGVGKTYAMLQEARELRDSGIDVVVGIVETHGRKDTEALLEGFEKLPPQTLTYREKEFNEFDVDKAIKRKPEVILLDELAHSNIPGSKHAKRWQDVFELLDSGIDVYSTLNVQHIDSLNDIVKGITQITVHETVPDHVIERSNAIRVVDLTPDELLLRLKQGKVYLGDQSVIAVRNFFHSDRLAALRQLILRYGADKVDRDLKAFAPLQERLAGWKPREKLMVLIDEDASSQQIIRATRRLAAGLDAPWIALHVVTSTHIDPKLTEQLSKNLALARELGAEVVTLSNPDLYEAIKQAARTREITQIVLRKERQKHIVKKLTEESSVIDLHIINLEASNPPRKMRFEPPTWSMQYIWVLLSVLLITFACWFALPLIGYKVIGVLFLLAILYFSLFFRKGPLLFAAVLSAIIWDILFIPERGSVLINETEDIALLILYILTAGITGILVDRQRQQKELLSRSEESSEVLYAIARQIALEAPFETIYNSIRLHLERLLNGNVTILLKDKQNELEFESTNIFYEDEKEKTVARWAFENGKDAGWSTSTFSTAQNLFIPLKGFRTVAGVLAYEPKTAEKLTIEQFNTLHAIAQLLAIHIERVSATEEEEGSQISALSEEVYAGVLKKTYETIQKPVLTIQNAVGELDHYHRVSLVKTGVMTQIHAIEQGLNELQSIMSDLSSAEKWIEGTITARKERVPVAKLLEAVIKRIERSSENFTWEVKLKDKSLTLYCDSRLIESALNNFALQAMKYAPPDSTISIVAERENDYVILSVADQGEQIPPHELDLFMKGKFEATQTPRLGFWTVSAKEIARLHSGYLRIENLPESGVKTSLYLIDDKS